MTRNSPPSHHLPHPHHDHTSGHNGVASWGQSDQGQGGLAKKAWPKAQNQVACNADTQGAMSTCQAHLWFSSLAWLQTLMGHPPCEGDPCQAGLNQRDSGGKHNHT